MQKLGLNQSLQQKLSPQQIQFIKLLQIPTAELSSRIEEELEINPALEEGREDTPDEAGGETDEFGNELDDYEDDSYDKDINVEDYIRDDDIAGYKMQGDGPGQEEERESPLASSASLADSLLTQLSFLGLDERQEAIGKQLIGSIDSDGYIRRDLEAIANDLAFSQNIETESEEIEKVLFMIQQFDPAGIAARDLQECLVLQLERRTDSYDIAGLALRIVEECFEEFTKKHYEKIQRKLDVDDPEDLRDAINMIIKLNPKPGEVAGTDVKMQYVIPDYILINNNGKLELSLNSRNAPELKVSRSYAEMLETYDKSDKKNKQIKETATFVKQKLDAAKWFIDAIKQRQQTLLKTMNAIVQYQYDFFLTGDESKLRPMILKDIATEIDMDISTVSRVANSKFVQTEFGIFPLKYFFSEGIATDTGEDVSSREVKAILKEFIDNEDKSKPLSDDKLEKLLNQRGYTIARRTVAKYREQLDIPVARLRKQF
jgi:RNA polymerase sigma-54 factor